jgi:hypothetical protein
MAKPTEVFTPNDVPTFSYKAFGDIRPPVSLDAPAYLDGTMPVGSAVAEVRSRAV